MICTLSYITCNKCKMAVNRRGLLETHPYHFSRVATVVDAKVFDNGAVSSPTRSTCQDRGQPPEPATTAIRRYRIVERARAQMGEMPDATTSGPNPVHGFAGPHERPIVISRPSFKHASLTIRQAVALCRLPCRPNQPPMGAWMERRRPRGWVQRLRI